MALSDCEVYAISSVLLKEVINQCPDLGDVILRAFMARRQLVRESGTFTGVRVIGSRYSQDTFRIRDFLARNRVPFTWLDLEGDPTVKDLLVQFAQRHAGRIPEAAGSRFFCHDSRRLSTVDMLNSLLNFIDFL